MNAEKYILLVEDNQDDILLTTRAFKQCAVDYPLIVASNGAEALDFLFRQGNHAGRGPQEPPTIVLLDINLPFINGLGVLEKIRANKATCCLPVVMLSSSKIEKDVARSESLGADMYFRKPVNYDEFLVLIEKIKAVWLT
jgi:two-component system response regulator